jgi:DNA-directed RNA polymerase specialized sigma24 family protein
MMGNKSKLNLKGYTPKQWSVLILRYDFRLSYREIAERMGMSISGVKHIIDIK